MEAHETAVWGRRGLVGPFAAGWLGALALDGRTWGAGRVPTGEQRQGGRACPLRVPRPSLPGNVTNSATRPEAPPTDPRSDAALALAVAAGDQDALALLYDRLGGIVLAVAHRILGDRAESEDLVHDVFVEVWQRAGQYEAGRASVRGWVLMIARSRALDRKRSARRARRVDLPDGLDAAAASMGHVDQVDAGTGAAGDRGRLDQALSGLPPAQREVILLAYFEGLSSTEMATRIGVPAGTVKSRTAAAFQKLREAFGDPGEEATP